MQSRIETSTGEPSGTRTRTLSKAERVLEAARSKLITYCSLTNEGYSRPAHLKAIAGILERVERGELRRVIITIPPRHGKSMLCSQYFPAWYMGRNPSKYLITATYGQELSDDFGRKVRDQIEDNPFRDVFPGCSLRSDSRASARFETKQGGTYYAVGVGGPVTGRGAHLLLIDDPIKNREDADSEAIRTKLIDWYKSVAYTRLMPGGAIVIITTRWHEEDLVGHVLSEHAHENWTKIDLKAVSNGVPLWPEAYNLETLRTIKATLGDYDWQCLYQQDPIPREGIIFKPEWMPSGFITDVAARYMAIDPAIGQKETNDETAMSCWVSGYGEPFQLAEVETPHGHWTFEEQIRIACELHRKHKFDLVGVEKVAYQAVLGEELARRGLPVIELKADKDKVRRAMSVSHLFSSGRVKVNSPDLKEQMLKFRGGSEKNDLADAAIHCVRMIRDYSTDGLTKKTDRYEGLSFEQIERKKSFERELLKYGDGLQSDGLAGEFNEIIY